MKFQLQNYQDYILFNQLEKAKKLLKNNPVKEVISTKIRNNATYYEFKIQDDLAYNVDIVIENERYVTVNRCSCGSIACSHLACCFEHLLKMDIFTLPQHVQADDEKKVIIENAIKSFKNKKLYTLLEYIAKNINKLKGWVNEFVDLVIKEEQFDSFDVATKKQFQRVIDEMYNAIYDDFEVYLFTDIIINLYVKSSNKYPGIVIDLLNKKFPIAYHTLYFNYELLYEMPLSVAKRVYQLLLTLEKVQKACEFAIFRQYNVADFIYPYKELINFVQNKGSFLPFDVNLVDDIEELINCIYLVNPAASYVLMDYFDVYINICFDLKDLLRNPEFFIKHYPDETKNKLLTLKEYLFTNEIDNVRKIIMIAKSFGKSFLKIFLNTIQSHLYESIANGDDYLVVDMKLPFKVDIPNNYYSYCGEREYTIILQPSLTTFDDELIALDIHNHHHEHRFFFNANHQIMGTHCYQCGYQKEPCHHQMAFIKNLAKYKYDEGMAKEFALIKERIADKRYELIRENQKNEALNRLNRYQKEIYIQNDDYLQDKADIIPVITSQASFSNEKAYKVSFQLCQGNLSYRLYPTKFNEAMREASDFAYGKKLHFKHILSNFTPRAKKIYDILCFFEEKETIQLPALRFANMLLDMGEWGIIFNDKKLKYAGKKLVTLEISNDKKLTIYQKDSLKGHLICTPETDFLFQDDGYYSLDYTSLSERIVALDILSSTDLYLDQVEKEFIDEVYPYLRKKIKISSSFAAENQIEQLIIKAYFDYQNNQICVNYQFYSHDIQLDEKNLLASHLVEIKPFLKALEAYNFQNNTLHNPQDIMRFINSDLSSIRNEAIVYISNRLKKLYESQKFNLRFKINQKNESILDVCFEELDYSEEELAQIYSAYKRKAEYILFDDKIVTLKDASVEEFVDLVDDLSLDYQKLYHEQDQPLYALFKVNPKEIELNLPDELKKLLTDIKNYSMFDWPLNPNLEKILRPYQYNGFKWMRLLLSKGLGCILADDMGIGKTLQTIALIDSLALTKPVLVCCPKNIIYNWEAEIKKWSPWLTSCVVTGNKKERMILFEKAFLNHTNIIIASYETIRIEEEYLVNLNFSLIILDEAQNIKNPLVERSKSVKALKADYRLALTGTPIENALSDAWSIFDFLMPGYLYKYPKFLSEIERSENYALLKQKLMPFVLRRTKTEVLKELPKKTEELVYIAFTEEEQKIYQAELLQAKKALDSDEKNRLRVLANITILRELCVDGRLLYENQKAISSKTETLLDMLDNLLINDHKVLIFSQYVKYLHLLVTSLEQKKISFYLLTGDTKAIDRQKMATDFNQNAKVKVFLVSLKAGGVGLNLIGADTVIHIDPWWNYAIESQASDRAYRIGQNKPVTVYKLIMKDSIEERVMNLQAYKKRLSLEVINENDEMMTKLSIKDFEALLN